MDQEVLENLFKGPEEYCQPDFNTLQEENNRLRRALRIMVRKYASIKTELETTRASIGYYNKYFRFLELPREVRDQIYDYALVPPKRIISPEARLESLSNLEIPHWLPPTSGILLVNKQISVEATEVLYSSNGFKFFQPQDLLRFEEMIGSTNREFVQHIFIYLEGQDKFPVQYLETTPHWNWEAIPLHWAKALTRSNLRNVIDMTVSINNLTMPDRNDQKVTKLLESAIKEFLSRNPKSKIKPRLILSGFNKSECDKFSKDWDVNFDEFDIEKSYRIYT